MRVGGLQVICPSPFEAQVFPIFFGRLSTTGEGGKMALKEILFEEKGPVAIITLNRPDWMNGLTMVTHRELEKAINYVEQEDRIRVLDPAVCLSCGHCKAVCPTNAPH
jgi:ferredoxin